MRVVQADGSCTVTPYTKRAKNGAGLVSDLHQQTNGCLLSWHGERQLPTRASILSRSRLLSVAYVIYGATWTGNTQAFTWTCDE